MFRSKHLRCCICVLLATCIFVIGCGGSHANCVDRYMPGDEKRSCSSLYAEIQTIDTEIEQKQAKKGERDTWNVIEFIGGIFLIVPFFFMDAKGSYEQEMAALEARQKQLKIFFADNGCSVAGLDVKPVAQDSNQNISDKFVTSNINSSETNVQTSNSDMIMSQCPHCKATFKAKRADLGKKTSCPNCKQIFTISEWAPALVSWKE